MTGAYKERGALNKILELTQQERDRGLIAASAGNHAQAVSYHASKRGIAAQIVMPMATPLNKVMATRRFGGEVVLHGANYDEACDEAKRRAAESGLTFIHAFDDDAVIAGQGTLGLELLSQTPDLDVVITADRRRRPDQRHGLRAEGDQSTHPRDWRADFAPAIDEGGHRCRTPGYTAGCLHPGRWYRRAPRRRTHTAHGAQVRRRNRDRRRGRDRQRDSASAGARKDRGRRRRSRSCRRHSASQD